MISGHNGWQRFVMVRRTWTQGKGQRYLLLLILIGALAFEIGYVQPSMPALAHSPPPPSSEDSASLAGRLVDTQGEPVHEADIAIRLGSDVEPVAHATSQMDGTFVVDLPPGPFPAVLVEIARPHFRPVELHLDEMSVALLSQGGSVRLPDLELTRRITAGFWVATLSFVLVLVVIALERLHKTTAALLGVALVLGTSSVGGAISPHLFIFDFEQALQYVDFDVIFLVLGMMIVIGVIEETGIFQWLAYQSYRMSRGKVWLLVTILMIITSIASALLDNVTTMLLMAPITIQIALTLGLNPVSLLIPEVLASNVGGISTLIGTPTNILIGSYAGLGFNDFVVNLTPGVLLAQAALTIYVILRYRSEYRAAGSQLSDAMRERLRESGRITQPVRLRKAGLIFVVMLVFFIMGDAIHLVPAVTAIIGAVLMLLWVAPDIEGMLKVVDWTTLMFFIALFIAVGALQEVGLISFIAGGIGSLVGDNLAVALLVLVWSAALLSGVIDNIPFAATMLPVVGFLSRTVPGATSDVLWYGLSVGAAMGGNTTLIGASPNLVTAGIAERAGYRFSYLEFLKIGLPSMIVTVIVGLLWLYIRFL
jgi:Na+/H+ antiporter NhaD/arsenite permease-like protein